MYNYDIYTDSTSDLTNELREKYGLRYVPMNVVVNDNELVANLDWVEFSAKEFYNWMREGKRTFTNQVPTHVFEEHFKSSLEKGKDVLYLGCSSALSGSINIAHTVAKELMEEYPGRKVICVDTLRATFAEGILAIKSAMLREEGYSIEENADWINEHKLESNLVCTVETLSYLKNAGRVKATTAFFGNILGVKPMLIEDALGNNFAVKKIKGRRASLLELINMMKETIVDPENQVIYLEHADSEIDCEFVREHIIDAFNPKEVYVSYVGPIIGSTTGPGTIIVSYFGKKVEIKGE